MTGRWESIHSRTVEATPESRARYDRTKQQALQALIQDHSYEDSRLQPGTCDVGIDVPCGRPPVDHRYFNDPAGPLQDPQFRMP